MRLAVLVFAGAAAAIGTTVFACASFHGEDSGSDEGGTPADDGGTPADEGGTPSSSGAPGSPSTIFCQGLDCDPSTDACCLTSKNTGTAACLPREDAGACNSGLFTCDDNADCAYAPGTVCCGTLGSEVAVSTSGCYSEINCRKVTFWVVLCDPSAGTSACPDAGACTLPKGGSYGFCDGLHF